MTVTEFNAKWEGYDFQMSYEEVIGDSKRPGVYVVSQVDKHDIDIRVFRTVAHADKCLTNWLGDAGLELPSTTCPHCGGPNKCGNVKDSIHPKK